MKKLLLTCALIVGFSVSSSAQQFSSGNLTATGDVLTAFVPANAPSVTVQVSGTWTGTLTFTGSVDGVTFGTLSATNQSGFAAATTTTSNGMFGLPSVVVVRVTATTLSSGTAAITFARGGGGGGGGGAAGSVTQGTTPWLVAGQEAGAALNVICTSGCSGTTLGQATMANSLPVTMASNQTAITVGDGSGALNTIVDSGTITAVTTVTNPVTVTDGAGALNTIVDSGTLTTVSTVTSLSQFAGSAITLGAGAVAAGTLRTTQASDSPLVTSAQLMDNAVGTVAAGTAATASLFGGGQYNSTPITLTNTQGSALQLDANGYLKVNTAAGGAAGGTSLADDADFTAGTTAFTPVGGFYQSTVTPCTDGDTCAAGLTTGRAVKVAISNADGSSVTVATDATRDSAAPSTGPLIVGNGSTATPTAMSADGDATAVWTSLNGAVNIIPRGSDGTLAFGTAGTAATPVLSVQGIASGTNLNVNCAAGCSGGTQYTQDAALTVATTVGTMAMGRASAAVPTDVSADNDAVIPWYLRSGAQATQPTFGGVLAVAGNGTSGTGVQRVTIASDSTGTVAVTQATASSLNATVVGTLASDGAAAATNRVGTLPAIAETTTLPTLTDGRNAALYVDTNAKLYTRWVDPCTAVAKSYYVVNLAATGTVEIANAVAGEFWYICSVNIVAQGANAVLIAHDDTDGCGSITAGMNGGTTAATGWGFAANGGISLGNGGSTIMKSATANHYLCIAPSTTAQISGTISYVSAP